MSNIGIDEGGRKVVLGTYLVEVSEVSANTNGSMFFVDGKGVRDP
jgi:hypothetical protein